MGVLEKRALPRRRQQLIGGRDLAAVDAAAVLDGDVAELGKVREEPDDRPPRQAELVGEHFMAHDTGPGARVGVTAERDQEPVVVARQPAVVGGVGGNDRLAWRHQSCRPGAFSIRRDDTTGRTTGFGAERGGAERFSSGAPGKRMSR